MESFHLTSPGCPYNHTNLIVCRCDHLDPYQISLVHFFFPSSHKHFSSPLLFPLFFFAASFSEKCFGIFPPLSPHSVARRHERALTLTNHWLENENLITVKENEKNLRRVVTKIASLTFTFHIRARTKNWQKDEKLKKTRHDKIFPSSSQKLSTQLVLLLAKRWVLKFPSPFLKRGKTILETTFQRLRADPTTSRENTFAVLLREFLSFINANWKKGNKRSWISSQKIMQLLEKYYACVWLDSWWCLSEK